MFNQNFYPTPIEIIEQITSGIDLHGKTILEPSAGKGDIVDFCIGSGAAVLACENHPDLQKIVSSKCKVIADDFLTVTSDMVSHIDLIIMNPPFNADEKHILHAWSIAPAGCQIIALCNWETLRNPYSRSRSELKSIVEDYGNSENLGNIFSTAERKTEANIGLINLYKAGNNESEFTGFFIEDEQEVGSNGIMPYNATRDLVNRYVAAIKLFDQQLELGVQMNNLTSSFFSSKLAFTSTVDGKENSKLEYKKDLQKSAWNWVFNKMNMDKYSTKGLREDMNKFVEKQTTIPFTMKNIYHMIDIIVGTTNSRMDKAIIEVFERVTGTHAENRYDVKGWKSNSHYMLGKMFIMDSYYKESMDDFTKALCFITGKNYDNFIDLKSFIDYRYKLVNAEGHYLNYSRYDFPVKIKEHAYRYNEICHEQSKIPNSIIEDSYPEYGQWIDWGFFQIKRYKKGTIHYRFKDEEVWFKFNREIGRIMGYPLFEHKEQTAYQKRNTTATKKAA